MSIPLVEDEIVASRPLRRAPQARRPVDGKPDLTPGEQLETIQDDLRYAAARASAEVGRENFS